MPLKKMAVEGRVGGFPIEGFKVTEDGRLMVRAGNIRLTIDEERNVDAMRKEKTPCGELVRWMGRFKMRDGKLMFMGEICGATLNAEFVVKEGKPYLDFTRVPAKDALDKAGIKIGKDCLVSIENIEEAVKKEKELGKGSMTFMEIFRRVLLDKKNVEEAAAIWGDIEKMLKNPRVAEWLEGLKEAKDADEIRKVVRSMKGLEF